MDITKLINVVGSGDGIGHDGGYSIKDWQVGVNVVVGHVVRLGVGIGVGNVLVGRLNISEVLGEDIEGRLELRRRFGTTVGSGVGGKTLGSTVGLVDGINVGLWLGTVTLSSVTGFDECRKDADGKGDNVGASVEVGASVGSPGGCTSA